MRPEIRSWFQLLTVQASWNYERMSGLGLGRASEPLLADLAHSDPSRHGDAIRRAAGFFNSHPYLAGVAAGAEVRAEYDGVEGDQIERLRVALCSPLGALGDQLFWAGVWPATIGLALAAVALGAGWWVPLAAAGAMLIVRLWVTRWALHTGLRAGMQVGAALHDTVLRRLIPGFGLAAAALVGVAVPLVIRSSVGTRGWPIEIAVAVALLGISVGQRRLVRVTGVGFGLAAIVVALFVVVAIR